MSKVAGTASSCSFVKLDGTTCKNKRSGSSEFCGMTGHTLERSNENVAFCEKREKYIREYKERTLDCNAYICEDVLGDDACLFRALTLGLFVNIEKIKHSDNVKAVFKHPETKLKEFIINIEDETALAKILQKIAKDWIVQNRKKKLADCGDETLEDIVLNTHNLDTIEDYAGLYSIFAGEFNKAYNADGELIDIPPRWGGYPEEVALSDIFEVNINIYVPRRICANKNSVIPSYKLRDGTRYEIYTNVKFNKSGVGDNGIESDDGGGKETDIPTINLLYLDKTSKPHYMLMLEK